MSDLPNDSRFSLLHVSKEKGVSDLPLKVRGAFAKAIIEERKGNHAEAECQLQKAVDHEANEK